MPRATGAERKRITITPSVEILTWIEERIGAGKPFGSFTHAFESGVVCMQKRED